MGRKLANVKEVYFSLAKIIKFWIKVGKNVSALAKNVALV